MTNTVMRPLNKAVAVVAVTRWRTGDFGDIFGDVFGDIFGGGGGGATSISPATRSDLRYNMDLTFRRSGPW